MFNKVLEKFGLVSKKPTTNEAIEKILNGRFEGEKQESSGAKELREQLEFVEELKKIPVERAIENFERRVPKNLTKFPHYFAETPNFTHLDIYMVSEMFQLNSYQHHIVKKAIATGKRGSKDQVKDLQEVIATAEAWIEAIEANKVLGLSDST